jgi:hypothetical protein
MATRTITTRILKGDETPWKYAQIYFRLKNDTYTDTAQFPVNGSQISAIANEYGRVTVSLWVNTEGDLPTGWICTLPSGKEYIFNIPPGSSAIEMSTLFSDYQEGSPQYSSLITYIEDYIDNLVMPGNENYQIIPITQGISNYVLSKIPTSPQKSRFYWNGLKQQFGIDYNIDSTILNILTDGITNTDLVEIYFL